MTVYPSEISGYIVYKEGEGLSTFYAKHKRDLPRPNYPVPALIQDSQSDLGLRWSNWLDADRLSGHKY